MKLFERLKGLLLLLLILGFLAVNAFAQQYTVTGTVTNAKTGNAMVGVNIW